MELEILPKPRPSGGGARSTRRGVRPKGRRFRAYAGGWIEASGLFVAPGLGADRVPIWIGLATTEASLRPFEANLRSGAAALEIDNSHRTLVLPTEIEYRRAMQSHWGVVTLKLWHAAFKPRRPGFERTSVSSDDGQPGKVAAHEGVPLGHRDGDVFAGQ